MRKIASLFIILNFACGTSLAQNPKIDSLLNVLKIAKEDTLKVKLLNKIASLIKFNNPDSTILLGKQALSLSKKLNFLKGESSASRCIATGNALKGNYIDALDFFMKGLKIDEKQKDSSAIASAYGNIGNIYRIQGDYPKALDYYLKGLKLEEKLGDDQGAAGKLGSIGILYRKQGDNVKALDYYNQSLKLYEKLNDKEGLSSVYNNIGLIYGEQKNNKKALEYYFKALEIDEELGNMYFISIRLGNIGVEYEALKEHDKALDYCLRALKISEKMEDKKGITAQLGTIGSIYFNLKDYSKAEDYLLKALKMDKEIGELYDEMNHEIYLSNIYDETKQYNLALLHYKNAMILKDTLFNQEKDKEITKKELNYEFEKKEAIAVAVHKIELENQQKIADEKSRKQIITTWLVFVGLLLVVVFAAFIFRSLKVTRKQKQLIEIQKAEVEHQKQLVEEHQKEIIDSINYARRIQNSLLPSEKYIEKSLKRLKD